MNAQALQETHGSPQSVVTQVEDSFAATVALRREIHQQPEIGLDLPNTRALVLAALEGLPLALTLHESTSGIAALLTGDKPGPTVLLRGDMDALPLPEESGVEFGSKLPGQNHACGHDMHTSMLVQAARILSERQGSITGRVLFMFQPGEEGYAGARYMLEEGLLDLPALSDGTPSPITGAFAVHMSTAIPTGMVAMRSGAFLASSDELNITVRGAGGHASEPHRTIDPIPAACEIVQALQTLVARRLNVFDSGVVSVTQINAGSAYNVIPDEAVIKGLIRAVSEETRKRIKEEIERVAFGVGAAHQMQVDVHIG